MIVGAGAAGLYAAYTLDNLGYSVLILEATPWHGGRIWSMNLGDVRIENGAEELYGATNNFDFAESIEPIPSRMRAERAHAPTTPRRCA